MIYVRSKSWWSFSVRLRGKRAVVTGAAGGIGAAIAGGLAREGATVDCLDMDLETFQTMIHRNLTSVFLTCSAFGREMAARGGGTIVVTSSQLAEVARPKMAHYAAAKGGVRQL